MGVQPGRYPIDPLGDWQRRRQDRRSCRLGAALHCASVVDTVVGESLEIYPFPGNRRLEQPLLRWKVQAAVRGYAHRGR